MRLALYNANMSGRIFWVCMLLAVAGFILFWVWRFSQYLAAFYYQNM